MHQFEFLRLSGVGTWTFHRWLRYTGPSPHSSPDTEKGQPMRPLQRVTLEAMIDLLSATFRLIPDARRPDRVDYSLHDTLLRGFAMLCFQHPSLLECQRKMQPRRGRCNLATLFGVTEVPSDTQRREILDGIPPELLRPLLPTLCEKIRRAGWARECTSLVPSGEHQGAYSTVMLDGTDYFHSTQVQCPGCLQRVDAGGEVHFRHTVVAAPLVKAGSHRVFPLEVEAVRNSDGQAKQDCERKAAQRLIPRLRQEHPQMPLIIGGDALYAHEPFIAQLRAPRLHHVFVCKPGAHAEVYKGVDDLARLGACAGGQWYEGPACQRRFVAYRVARQIPLTTTRRIWCPFVEVWERDRTGKLLYHHAWVTALEVESHNVAAIVRIGRARWKY